MQVAPQTFLRRLVLLCAGSVALLCFAWHLTNGSDLLYSSLVSLGVMFALIVVFRLSFRSIGAILMNYLVLQQREQHPHRFRDPDSKSSREG